MDFFDNCIYFDLHGISFVPMVLWLLEKPSTTYRQNCKPYQSNLLVHICMMYLRLHSNGMGKCNIKSICKMSVNLDKNLTSIVVIVTWLDVQWAPLLHYHNTIIQSNFNVTILSTLSPFALIPPLQKETEFLMKWMSF